MVAVHAGVETSARRAQDKLRGHPRLAWLKDQDHVQGSERASGCKINEQERERSRIFCASSPLLVGPTACRTVLRHSQHAAL